MMSALTAISHCPQCGVKLSRLALGGLCHRCVGLRLLSAGPLAPAGAETADPADMDESVGLKLGPYVLVRKIGEGGCGVVYAATQEEPIRRQVAIKVIKLGMDTRAVVARFEAERQALAMMEHPNITKIFDAGSTVAGRPYFVMEMVEGVRITDYADQQQLTIEARLGLFMTVCQAVQHAHQKGIIHRDLKPSNILVATEDDSPVVKIIDFGIAKATEQRLTEATLVTEVNQPLGTPAYMSPEQANMEGIDIDTRSDIYSLGALLYELLTGRTPFDAQEMFKGGLAATRRLILEANPPRPSARLASLNTVEAAPLAQARCASLKELVATLRGDPDWITMKCLEKDPADRYVTANELAQDIQRYLTDEPVTASPPSAIYRIGKFARRNKIAFAVGTVFAVVLVAATAISLWQVRRASQAERLATERLADSQNARQESEALSKFLTDAFRSPDPSRDGRSVTVAETLDGVARKIETELAGQPDRRARFQSTLGASYLGLGLYREAIALQEKVRAYYLGKFGLENSNTLEAMQTLAYYNQKAGNEDKALPMRRELLRLREKVSGADELKTIEAMSQLADSCARNRLFDDEVTLRRNVLAVSREALGPEHPDTLEAMRSLAGCANAPAGEKLQLWEDLLPACRKVFGDDNAHTVEALSGLTRALNGSRDQHRVLEIRRELAARSLKVFGPNHALTLDAIIGLRTSYLLAPELMDATAGEFLRTELARLRQTETNNDPLIVDCVGCLAEFYSQQKQYADAASLWVEAIDLIKKKEISPGKLNLRLMNQEGAFGNMLADWAWSERTTNTSAARDHSLQAVALLRKVVESATNDRVSGRRRVANWSSTLGGALEVMAAVDTMASSTEREITLTESESILLEADKTFNALPDSADWELLYMRNLKRLVRLYEVWNKPEHLSVWKRKLEDGQAKPGQVHS